jgi:DNA-binding beta-propeller fold protein YncE
MLRRVLLPVIAGLLLLFADRASGPISAEMAMPMLKATEPPAMCAWPDADLGYSMAQAGQARADQVPAAWPGRDVPGGDVPPVRIVTDPYPTFDGLAVDPENNVVVMSDENRGALLLYDRTSGGHSAAVTEPKRHIIGPRTDLGFIAGVTLDPKRREAWVVNNDGGGVDIFSYDQHGDAKPIRELEVPHQSWGLSLDLTRDELAITSQQYQGISIFARTATGIERPLRTIRGENTQLADPHGVYLDGPGNEVFAANHGNWTEMRSYADDVVLLPGEYKPGRFELPSIRVYRATADGNVPPIRTIQGDRTQLAWPMGIDVHRERGELAVANYGTDSVLIFARAADGNVGPLRMLGGPRTGIEGPVAVGFDRRNGELWVANYGDHTAVVFDADAVGDVAPKRIIRNAPAGTPTTGFTNASAAAYDSRRGEVLVPNCVSVPRISAFSRLANGNVAPDRIIEGQVTSLSRTMHGIAYDAVHDEIIVPVALSGAILVFQGGARGNEPPIRVIQGSDTGLIRPHTANVDPVSGEILAGDPSARGVLVFDRLANGNVKPKRVIAGPKTQFREIVGVASDAKSNAIVVASRAPGGPSGLFVFNRLDQGDVAPKRIIAGPLTGAIGRFRQVSIDPERGKIYLAVQAFRAQEPTPQKAADLYESETSLNKLRALVDEEGSRARGGIPQLLQAGFIGVWNIDDNGNVPPRMIIRGPSMRAAGFAGVAFNPDAGEVYGVSGDLNGYLTYLVPQFFQKPGPAPTARR